MSHKLISSIIALAFLVLIQISSAAFRFMLPTMVLFLAAVLGYNRWYLKQQALFTFWSWLRLLFFYCALIGIYFIIQAGVLRGLFLLAALAMIYFVEAWLAVPSEQIVFWQTLLAYFGLCLGVFGFNFYLLPRSTLTLFLLALMTFFVARCSFDYIPRDKSKKNFFAGLIALAILELSWGLVFLPIHYSVLALMLFNIFYVLWIIVYHHLFHNLTLKKITFHLIFSSVLIIIALIATPWHI